MARKAISGACWSVPGFRIREHGECGKHGTGNPPSMHSGFPEAQRVESECGRQTLTRYWCCPRYHGWRFAIFDDVDVRTDCSPRLHDDMADACHRLWLLEWTCGDNRRRMSTTMDVRAEHRCIQVSAGCRRTFGIRGLESVWRSDLLHNLAAFRDLAIPFATRGHRGTLASRLLVSRRGVMGLHTSRPEIPAHV